MRTLRTALLAGVGALALIGSAQATPIPLQISLLPAIDVVPQSASAPCIICGTNQAHNPPTLGFNDFTNTGNLSSFNTFSTNVNPGGGGQVAGDLEGNATPYTGALLENFLNAQGTDPLFKFGVAVDVNTAGGPGGHGETLQSFQLIDLNKSAGERVVFELAVPPGGFPLAVAQQGNGHADYLISGFDLSSGCRSSGSFVLADCLIQPGDNLLFHASWTGASDGAESFYIVAVPSVAPPDPIPEPGSIALLGSGLVGFGGVLAWRRRKDGSGPNPAAA